MPVHSEPAQESPCLLILEQPIQSRLFRRSELPPAAQASGRESGALPTSPARSVSVSPEGRVLVATASGAFMGSREDAFVPHDRGTPPREVTAIANHGSFDYFAVSRAGADRQRALFQRRRRRTGATVGRRAVGGTPDRAQRRPARRALPGSRPRALPFERRQLEPHPDRRGRPCPPGRCGNRTSVQPRLAHDRGGLRQRSLSLWLPSRPQRMGAVGAARARQRQARCRAAGTR